MADPSMTLPVTPDNIHAELESVEAIVKKWREYIGKEGIPGIDKPAQDAEAKLDSFLRQFTGEILFTAGKLQNLAVVLSDR
jgi:hypothetical protein